MLVNVFTLDKADEPTFLWPPRQGDAAIMKRQPGFISDPAPPRDRRQPDLSQPRRRESTADFRAAFANPEFRAKLSAYPASAVASPHLFQKVAVPGVGGGFSPLIASSSGPRASGSLGD